MEQTRFKELIEKYSIDDADMTEFAEAITEQKPTEDEGYKAKYDALKADYISRFFGEGAGAPKDDPTDDKGGKDNEEKLSLADIMKMEEESK